MSRRFAIVVAGPMANFLLAILVFAAVFMWSGRETTIARIGQQPNSAAAVALDRAISWLRLMAIP